MDIKKLKEIGVYEYIANYYYSMSKEEIKDIALEMIRQLTQCGGNYDLAQEETAKVLEDEE